MGFSRLPTDFYEAIGKLFYAVAMADRSFMKDEKKEIVNLVAEHWSEKLFYKDADELVYQSIRASIAEEQKSQEAFSIFKAYYLLNGLLFTKEIKKVLLEDTNAIGSSYSKRNKSESAMYAQLYLLFTK